MDDELFEKARKKFGSHRAVARQLGISARTYLDWRLRRRYDSAKAQKAQWGLKERVLRSLLEVEDSDHQDTPAAAQGDL